MILVDANNQYAKYFYQLNWMKHDDKVVGGLYGFLKGLYHLKKKYSNEIIVIWDGRNARERKQKLYTTYKNRRPGFTDMFITTRNELKKVLADYIGIPQVEAVGYEADDVIGYFVKILKKQENGEMIYIVSSDKDFWQLIDVNVGIWTKGGIIGLEEFQEKTGCQTGEEYLKCRALVGDPSDGIKGIEGVGMKTAIRLVNSEIPVEYMSIYGRNLKLMELGGQVTNLHFKSCKKDLVGFVDFCMKYKFQSLIEVAEELLK